MPTDDQELSQDVIFDVLSSSRRRYVLYYLSQREQPVELPSLAEEVAAWETETSVEELSSQERKRVYVSLYQTHIPKLAEVGLVDYDQDSGEVSLTDRSEQVQSFLREPASRQGRLASAAVAVGTSLLVLIAGIVVVPGVRLTPGLLAVLAVWAAITTAIAYALYRRGVDGQFPPTLKNR